MDDVDLIAVHETFASSIYPVLCNHVSVDEMMLPMNDGVKLRTVLVRTDNNKEAYPTILVRTPYQDMEKWYMAVAEEYAKRGFAFVIQFCRGTVGSEGEWEPNVNERADGKVTVDWLCSLSWVESVGYMGVSYMALTGWTIADILPEKVKTMYLSHYGVFRHISAYKDGLFRHDVLTAWSMGNAGYDVTADYLESCKYQPHSKVAENLWGKPLNWYRKWVTATDEEDEYWNEGIWGLLKTIPGKITIPIMISEGWYDHHLASGLKTYHALSEDSKAKSTLVIGPWDHWFDVPIEGHVGHYYENNDLIRAYEWFRKILVCHETETKCVKMYVIGGDYWIERKDEVTAERKDAIYISFEYERTKSSCLVHQYY